LTANFFFLRDFEDLSEKQGGKHRRPLGKLLKKRTIPREERAGEEGLRGGKEEVSG